MWGINDSWGLPSFLWLLPACAGAMAVIFLGAAVGIWWGKPVKKTGQGMLIGAIVGAVIWVIAMLLWRGFPAIVGILLSVIPGGYFAFDRATGRINTEAAGLEIQDDQNLT